MYLLVHASVTPTACHPPACQRSSLSEDQAPQLSPSALHAAWPLTLWVSRIPTKLKYQGRGSHLRNGGVPPPQQLLHHKPPSKNSLPLEGQLRWSALRRRVGSGPEEGPETFWETSCAFPLTADPPPRAHLGCLSWGFSLEFCLPAAPGTMLRGS